MYLLNFSAVLLRIMPWAFKTFGILKPFWGHASVEYPFYWIVTIVWSWMLYRYFEQPVMDLRERIHFHRPMPKAGLPFESERS
jgi:peptidoglycan/LPS O-acetylase OafA/YrhL